MFLADNPRGNRTPVDVNRRTFLHTAAVALVGTGLAAPAPNSLRGEEKPSASEIIPGKDAALIVYNHEPVEIETPLNLLGQSPITPKELLFVRNNGQMPGALSLDPLPCDGWSIDVAGLVEFPQSIAAERLRTMPQVEHEIVLQCSGNGRSNFGQAAPVKGSPWRNGAMGNVRFKGVALRELVRQLGCNVAPQAKFVTAEGRDAPLAGKADFEHSVPLDEALDKSFIALELNGQALPAVHGGPVRFITPGYYATMNVKWLTRLRFEAHETFNHNQTKRYRTPLTPIKPGSSFDYNFANSEPNWRMLIKSVIFSPLDAARLTAGKHTIRGVAWNDGTAAIDEVQVSIDAGRTWRQAQLKPTSSPYAWRHWQLDLQLSPGAHSILSRAVDAQGRTQPLDGAIRWNPDGYTWNGVSPVRVEVS